MNFYLNKLSKINCTYYQWNEKMTELTGKSGSSYGVLAQEIQKEFPEMVFLEEDGYYSVDYIQLIPVMIQAIKELKQEIDILKVNK